MRALLLILTIFVSVAVNASEIELFSEKYHSNTDFSANAKFVVNYSKSTSWVDLWYRYFDGVRHHTDFKTISVEGLKLNELRDAIIYKAGEVETRCADLVKKANKLIIRPTGFCRFEKVIKLKSDRSCTSCYFYVVNLVID
jgi:hypothetical protein